MTATEPSVLIKQHPLGNGKSIGMVTLNRPKSLNALTFDMFGVVRSTLRQWRDDSNIVAIMFNGSGERAFCSGGDVSAVRNLALSGKEEDIITFFQWEYTGLLELRAFPKPTIAYGHGYTMGGGLGIFQAMDHRIATQNTVMAMPEINIGLYPDVAATKFFDGIPLWLKRFLGMTSAMLNSRDIYDCHLADAIVPDNSLNTVLDALSRADLIGDRDADAITIKGVLADLAPDDLLDDLPDGNVMPHWNDIRQLCHAPSLPDVIKNMQTHRQHPDLSKWMGRCIDTLLAGCPNTAGIWWIMADEGRLMSIQQVLKTEMALSLYMTHKAPDFTEGVRAVLVDKDRNPKWSNTWDTLDMKHLQAIWTECTMTDLEFDESGNEGWAYEQN